LFKGQDEDNSGTANIKRKVKRRVSV